MTTHPALRDPATSRRILLVLVLYCGLSAFGYSDGFVRCVLAGGRFHVMAAGPAVDLSEGRYSLVTWARIPILAGSLFALERAAHAFRVGRVDARLLSFGVFFGLLLP